MNEIKNKLKADFQSIEQLWDDDIIPTLCDYIKIPNKSPIFDKDWKSNGYMDEAMRLIANWCQQHPLKGMQLDLLEAPDRTPLLFIDIPGHKNTEETVLLYGHMDKQPEMRGWQEGKSPWQPVIEDGKLYGRGGADDGYSTFAAMSAIHFLQKNDIPHARCIVFIEASEESGSFDLEYYLKRLGDRINQPSLIIGLDSGAGNYEQLWGTTSLRGVINGDLEVKILKKGMHSGTGGGVVPPIFSVLSQLMSRVQDPMTGKVIREELHVDIPEQTQQQASTTANVLKDTLLSGYQFSENTQPVDTDIKELLLNRSWRPALTITGLDGIPKVENAGNVTIPKLMAKLSLRIPPTLDTQLAHQTLKEAFETDPPFNADVTYTPVESGEGWRAPTISDWLLQANNEASELFFGKTAEYIGEGGSIPFMGMLGDMFPKAQFLITGVLGPLSNAHGPNEFLHIDYVKRLTGCVAYILTAHYHEHH